MAPTPTYSNESATSKDSSYRDRHNGGDEAGGFSCSTPWEVPNGLMAEYDPTVGFGRLPSPAPHRPSSPASVELAIQAVESMFEDCDSDDDDDEGSHEGSIIGRGVDGEGGSFLSAKNLLPMFNSKGEFTSYERRLMQDEMSDLADIDLNESSSCEILESSPYGFLRKKSAEGSSSNINKKSSDKSTRSSGTRKKSKKAVEDPMSSKQQSAMDQFLTNPSGMNWEDLVKSMKKKNKRRKRARKNNKRGSSLTPVEEIANEEYERSSNIRGSGEETIDFAQDEEQPAIQKANNTNNFSHQMSKDEDDGIDFFPTFNFSGFRWQHDLIQTHHNGDEEANMSNEDPSSRKRGRKKRAIVCTVLVLLVGIISGVVAVRSYDTASQKIAEGQVKDAELIVPSSSSSQTSKQNENESDKKQATASVEPKVEVDAGKSSKTEPTGTATAKDDSQSTTLTIEPAAVATIRESDPKSTHGIKHLGIQGVDSSVSDKEKVGERKISFLRFHLSPSLSKGDKVLQAKIELHLTTHPDKDAIVHVDVLPNAGKWVHEDISWDTPVERKASDRVTSFTVNKGSKQEMVEVDVTKEMHVTHKYVTFELSTDSDVNLDFASEDWKDGKMKPRLVVLVTRSEG